MIANPVTPVLYPLNRISSKPSRPRASTLRYHGVPRSAGAVWLGVVVSVGLHAFVLLGFNRHVIAQKTKVADGPVEQMQMMPVLDDPKEDEPKELNDDDPAPAPAVTVPMLADVLLQIPVESNFIQQLDPTVPLKADSQAGKLVSIPVNIQHGRPDSSNIKNLFNPSELDRVPEPIVQTQPDYPFELKRAGIDGRVRVGFIVDSQGNVILPYIVSSTNRGFERAAIEALQKWKFRPGMKSGRKVNTRVEQPITFNVPAGSSV